MRVVVYLRGKDFRTGRRKGYPTGKRLTSGKEGKDANLFSL